MPDIALSRMWLDVSATIGNGSNPSLAFRKAVHLAIYAAQDMASGPITPTTHPPKRLAEKLRRGFPLSDEVMGMLGEGRWPLPDDAFAIDKLPRAVPVTPVKDGSVTWTLTEKQLLLRKAVPVGGNTYVTDVEIVAGAPPRIRQIVGHIGGRAPVAGVPKGLKLISAVCGLYDGGIRILPQPIFVDTNHDAELFLKVVEDGGRLQPLVAVAAVQCEESQWLAEVEAHAREAFALQHVAAVTVRGVRSLRELLGPHGLPEGAIKTYNSGFTRLDVPSAHPVTVWGTIQAHERGRTGMLERLRKRLMTRDARDRAIFAPSIPTICAKG